MRRLAPALAAVLLLAVAGCGGGDAPDGGAGETPEPARSAAARQLASLCERARADTEALGLPGDKGFAVVAPTAAIGIRLGRAVGRIHAATPLERTRLTRLARNIEYYYREMQAGAKLYRLGQPDAYVATMERAKPVQKRYEAQARQLGAPECAVRPFPDS